MGSGVSGIGVPKLPSDRALPLLLRLELRALRLLFRERMAGEEPFLGMGQKRLHLSDMQEVFSCSLSDCRRSLVNASCLLWRPPIIYRRD